MKDAVACIREFFVPRRGSDWLFLLSLALIALTLVI